MNLGFNIMGMSSQITNYTNNGNCSNCGGCCSNFIPVSPLEIRRIKNFLYKNNIKEQRLLVPTYGKNIDLTCPFLKHDKETKCLIYPVRPLICKRFICSQPLEVVKEQKNELIKLYGTKDLRKEFFGHPSFTLDDLKEIKENL